MFNPELFMENASFLGLEFEKSGFFAQINIGDATLLTSLLSISRGKPTVLIDKDPVTTDELMRELSSGIPVFSFLQGSKRLRHEHAVIYRDILSKPDRADELRRLYAELWEAAKPNRNLLHLVPISVEDARFSLSGPKPLADLVTYYYPPPVTGPILATAEFAGLVLTPDGQLDIITESGGVYEDFKTISEGFIVRDEWVRGSQRGAFVSAYDLALGRQGYHHLTIANRNGGYFDQVSKVNRGLGLMGRSIFGRRRRK